MKVYLIGAGPGDAGLLTLKGRDALAGADVVVYDALANEALLDHVRPDAEKIYVGKVAGNHALPQDQINALLVAKAREGKVVARLKGGDPYIFGRGGEEAEELVAAGVPFEEVPGISSTVAAPAYAGIPLTHRDFASSVTIITGHENPDKPGSVHNWAALAASAATLVFVMGMKNLPDIVRNLLAAACIWIYVAAAGFPPSAVRAAVMFTMLQSALASASEYNGLNALAAAAFGMLLWNPAWLGDISFQLSFAAVAAILAWGVPLCRRLRTRRRALNPITDALAVSLAATLATAPLVSHTFGIVPLAGVVVNPAAILLGSVVVLAGALWMLLPVGWAAPAFECVLSHTAEGLNALARVTADLPCTAAEYALGGGATAAVYLFFTLATVAAWSAEPKKSVHLPA